MLVMHHRVRTQEFQNFEIKDWGLGSWEEGGGGARGDESYKLVVD
jgi:hypothetical protein